MAEYNYAALASTIKIEDITSDEHNQTILQRLKDNDTSLDKLLICEDVGMIFGEGTTIDYYSPDFDNVIEELGWLGYYIGQNTTLQKLYFYDFYENRHTNMYDSERPFFQGLDCNKSIQEIHVDNFDLSEGSLFSMMGPFFKSNDSLSKVEIENCEFGVEGIRQLSLAIGNCGKSLKSFCFRSNDIGDGNLADIITALSMHPQLTELCLSNMNIGRNECTALSTLLRCTTTRLQKLNLDHNYINDDEGMGLLLPSLYGHTLRYLDLGSNRSITTTNWKIFSTILEVPGSTLQKLIVSNNNIGDEGALVFANALVGNSTLKLLSLQYCGITAEGWAPFAKLLCDTSSIMNTYMSNHTLENIHRTDDFHVNNYLVLNRSYQNKQQVAMSKILQYHSHFDMRPFFEWEFKVLPIMINWFVKATATAMNRPGTFVYYSQKINKLRLAVIYDFIKAFPMLYVESVTRQDIADYTALEEELQAGDLMRGEQEVRLEEIRQCKARSMRRLGMK